METLEEKVAGVLYRIGAYVGRPSTPSEWRLAVRHAMTHNLKYFEIEDLIWLYNRAEDVARLANETWRMNQGRPYTA